MCSTSNRPLKSILEIIVGGSSYGSPYDVIVVPTYSYATAVFERLAYPSFLAPAGSVGCDCVWARRQSRSGEDSGLKVNLGLGFRGLGFGGVGFRV